MAIKGDIVILGCEVVLDQDDLALGSFILLAHLWVLHDGHTKAALLLTEHDHLIDSGGGLLGGLRNDPHEPRCHNRLLDGQLGLTFHFTDSLRLLLMLSLIDLSHLYIINK